MKTKKIYLHINEKKASKIEELLNKNSILEDEPAYSIYESFTVNLTEHLSVDIKVCVADDKTLFIDAVLFFDDTEVYCLEPIYDLLGEYIFEYDNVRYIIIVKKKG